MIRLEKAMIHQYKCIEKPQELQVKKDITVLMGCNEAGKTSVLEALAKSDYFDRRDERFAYNCLYDYPRRIQRELEKSRKVPMAVTLTFRVEGELLNQIREEMLSVPKSPRFSRETNYSGQHHIIQNEFEYDAVFFWEAYASQKEIELSRFCKGLAGLHTKEEYQRFCERMKSSASKEEMDSLKKVERFFENPHQWENPLNEYVFRVFLLPNIPKFMYYDDYYILPGRISLDDLSKNENLTSSERTAKAFLALAEIDIEKIKASNMTEEYKIELETAQSKITEEFLKYWKNNPNLRIVFEVIKEPLLDKTKKHIFFRRKKETRYHTWLEIRLQNLKTGVSLPLENQSRGFNWFFSFWIWFKAVQKTEETPYILLLDEPGMNLYKTAQKDLVDLMDDLSKQYQILFTTHSEYILWQMPDRVYCVSTEEDGTNIRPLRTEGLFQKQTGTKK